MREAVRFTLVALLAIAGIVCIVLWPAYGFASLGIMVFLIGISDIIQKKNAVLRNFPVLGHIRYLLQMISPEIHQYFIESDTDGKPIDRNHRQYVYTRAHGLKETHPFGTELNIEEAGFKWMQHSIYPAAMMEKYPRIVIGGADCEQPYSASLFNISAMSYGALSKNAVMALNLGAKAGDFFHDTGEGGLSEYHLKGGDLVWELGTGYFGCRNKEGNFDADLFKEKSNYPEVKMIEIKLSQGAKPGHGGVLPAAKNNEEIARIRGVVPHTDVISPPGHTAFHDAKGLLEFVQQLRELANGKPVGFKLCIGNKKEFTEICEQMVQTGIKPDFITVDGAEGGTGAAPIDFSNYVGWPWEKALIFVVDSLVGYNLKKDVKVITATKILTAFDIFKALAMGADICNSARGMMLALGCIQALKCDTNKCPTGVTTNNPKLMRGLVVQDKWEKVKNYHHGTLDDFLDLAKGAGCATLEDLHREMICKQVGDEIKSYEELYPSVKPGAYL